MPSADEPWTDPAHHVSGPCPLCDDPVEDAVVVGMQARFGMSVRNVACRRCGLVRVDPRPTPEAMDAYYRGPYRAQYRTVKLPTGRGTFVGPDDPGYLEARRERYQQQAQIALRLGGPAPGARVLEVGCRDAQTLLAMRGSGRGGLRRRAGTGGSRRGAGARGRRLVGLLEELTLGPGGSAPGFPEAFDQVQMFHVLEHLHEPLAALSHLGSWLRPGGRLILEVPNVTHPYGPLEANFFQNAHLTSFSANTLSAMLHRAGLAPIRVVDAGTLYVVAERPRHEVTAPLPLPFIDPMLHDRRQTGRWVAERLDTYRLLERAKQTILQGKVSMDQLVTTSYLLQRPAFTDHLIATLRGLVLGLRRRGAPRAALTLLRAAAQGPHPSRVAVTCAELAREAVSATPVPEPA
ncbi:MAG: class I SAM-dependent methyltransferase [Sandaracinaceae bacterium]